MCYLHFYFKSYIPVSDPANFCLLPKSFRYRNFLPFHDKSSQCFHFKNISFGLGLSSLLVQIAIYLSMLAFNAFYQQFLNFLVEPFAVYGVRTMFNSLIIFLANPGQASLWLSLRLSLANISLHHNNLICKKFLLKCMVGKNFRSIHMPVFEVLEQTNKSLIGNIYQFSKLRKNFFYESRRTWTAKGVGTR